MSSDAAPAPAAAPFDIDQLGPFDRAAASADDGPLFGAFKEGLSTGELISMMDPSAGPAANRTPDRMWRHILLSMASQLDKDPRGTRFVIQDASQTRAVTIDVMGPALLAPSVHASYSGTEGAAGPLLAVRFLETRRTDKERALDRSVAALVSSLDDRFPSGYAVDTFVSFDMSDSVMDACVQGLLSAREMLCADCTARFANAPISHKGAFSLSFLSVPRPEQGRLTKVVCSNPGCGAAGGKQCLVCRTPYCSKECQHADWKTHKRVCAQRAAGAAPVGERPSVLVDPKTVSRQMTGDGPAEEKRFFNMSIGGKTTTGKLGKDTLRYDPNRPEYIIKVQGGMFGGSTPLMIYDQERSFQLSVDADTSPGREIARYMGSHRSVPGSPYPGSVKVFLHARTEAGGLRVFLDKLAPWQGW